MESSSFVFTYNNRDKKIRYTLWISVWYRRLPTGSMDKGVLSEGAGGGVEFSAHGFIGTNVQ